MDNLLENKLFTPKQVGYIIGAVIIATFTVTMVYATFITMGQDMDTLKGELKSEIDKNSDRIEYVNDRIDRKIKSSKDELKLEIDLLGEEVNSHEKRLDLLEKPNSDK